MSFDPNSPGVDNGNVFGLPVSEEEADLVIIPVPWDVTASYGKGAAHGPAAIQKASLQIDLFHHAKDEAWRSKIFMTPISEEWFEMNARLNQDLSGYFEALEAGGQADQFKETLAHVNEAQLRLKQNLTERCKAVLDRGQKVAVLGGEHSSPLGLIEELAGRYPGMGILQVDAHADLRPGYEGFSQSHASIMHHALKCEGVSKLVQVGVRDFSQAEYEIMRDDKRISAFTDRILKHSIFEGGAWEQWCERFILQLPKQVYISLDIDGLDPSLCPNTGTPVPGGLSFEQLSYLLDRLRDSNREVVGFDLCEVAPGQDEWDANVGARVLWELCMLLA